MGDPRAPDIQLDTDMRFQRREWGVQRVGWVVMVGILVLAVLGFLGGPGLMSATHWGEQGSGIRVEGRRVERHHRPTELDVRIAEKAIKEGRVELWVDSEFLEKMQVERIVPEPVEMRREGTRAVMVLALKGSDPLVRFHMEPEGVGKAFGRMGIVGGDEVEVRQWVLP
jgi:hypothetical protein